MAKNLKRVAAFGTALALCAGMMTIPAFAKGGGGGRPGGNQGGGDRPGYGDNDSDQYEWYQVYVQGNLVASGQGNAGNVYYLGTSYKAGVSASGPMLSWYINPKQGNAGSFGGTVDLRDYITVPDGYTVKDYTIEESSIDGVNNDSTAYMYDNAIIKITIKTLYNEETGETIPVPVETKVTVNHHYYTYDKYTDETVLDGSASSTAAATEDDIYTATAVTAYDGNEYIRQTEDAALTITIVADENENVININYLREIDTTPVETEPPETEPPETEPPETEPPETEPPETEPPETEPPETEPPVTEPPETEPPETEPPVTEPPETEPPETEPPVTEPPETEPPETEPPVTEPPETEPPVTEPPETEPPETEPPATEPPATEPPATEPPATEPPATEPPATEPPATEPPATEPPATEPPAQEPPQDYGVAQTNDDGLIDIFDEDVPLADVPKTGDISTLWMALSSLSAGGLILLNKKRKS